MWFFKAGNRYLLLEKWKEKKKQKKTNLVNLQTWILKASLKRAAKGRSGIHYETKQIIVANAYDKDESHSKGWNKRRCEDRDRAGEKHIELDNTQCTPSFKYRTQPAKPAAFQSPNTITSFDEQIPPETLSQCHPSVYHIHTVIGSLITVFIIWTKQ